MSKKVIATLLIVSIMVNSAAMNTLAASFSSMGNDKKNLISTEIERKEVKYYEEYKSEIGTYFLMGDDKSGEIEDESNMSISHLDDSENDILSSSTMEDEEDTSIIRMHAQHGRSPLGECPCRHRV